MASAASGLRLTPRDLARIGQLVLDGGAWQDHQVVPATWLGAMLRERVRIGDGFHYGCQWYLGGAARSRWVGGIGNGGQDCSCSRSWVWWSRSPPDSTTPPTR